MVSKNKKDDELKIIPKISNPFELFAFILRFRLKEFLLVLIFVLISIVVLQSYNFDFSVLKFWGGK